MAADRAIFLDTKRVQIGATVSSPPTPTYANAIDIRALKRKGIWSVIDLERVTGSPCTLTGPVTLYIGRAGKLYYASVLNQGQDIALTADIGYTEPAMFIANADRALLVPAGISGSSSYDAFVTVVESQ